MTGIEKKMGARKQITAEKPTRSEYGTKKKNTKFDWQKQMSGGAVALALEDTIDVMGVVVEDHVIDAADTLKGIQLKWVMGRSALLT